MKLVLLAGVVAGAFGQSIDDAVQNFQKNSVDVNALNAGIDEQTAKFDEMQKEIHEIVTMYTKSVDGDVLGASEVEGDLVQVELNAQNSVESSVAKNWANAQVKMYQSLGQLDQTLDDVAMEAEKQSAQLQAEAENDLATARKNVASLADEAAELMERLEAVKDCNSKGMIYDPAKMVCKGPQIAPRDRLPSVYHGGTRNNDGRDHGWINDRNVLCEKKFDETYLRVQVHDNFRVHGHTAHGRWRIMFCDENGNNCADCNKPGRIINWKYSNHQHNWWMNDHWSGSITGLCQRTSRGVLKKGKHRIKMLLQDNRYDMSTGHNQYNSIQCDEVMVQA